MYSPNYFNQNDSYRGIRMSSSETIDLDLILEAASKLIKLGFVEMFLCYADA